MFGVVKEFWFFENGVVFSNSKSCSRGSKRRKVEYKMLGFKGNIVFFLGGVFRRFYLLRWKFFFWCVVIYVDFFR